MRSRRFAVLSMLVAISVATLVVLSQSQASQENFKLKPTIVFTSTRDGGNAEIFAMNPDGTNQRRLTNNGFADGFPAVSPDGKQIVFDSRRLLSTPPDPFNTSDLFLMNVDDYDPMLNGIPDVKQVHLTRGGGSPIWSPDGKQIAFHASASGRGLPIKNEAGAATDDSDIFVMNVDHCVRLIELTNLGDCRTITVGVCDQLMKHSDVTDCREMVAQLSINITNDGATFIDDDPDWSPDGKKIVFTSHDPSDLRNMCPPNCNPANPLTSAYPNVMPSAEIYVINADGTGTRQQLTFNNKEERAVDWSNDGTRIAYMCRIGDLDIPLGASFEICVMNADGTNQRRLTNDGVFDASPVWSPDGQEIVFHRSVRMNQLFKMTADGMLLAQLTFPPGHNLLQDWGVLRVKVP